MVVPMLTDEEYGAVARDVRERLSPGNLRRMCDGYNDLTGFGETNPYAVFHHVLSLYGPPCEGCGLPLRTPRARLCAACWRPRT
jgi:hypothetical protein